MKSLSPLINIVNKEFIPDEIEFLENSIKDILTSIRYKNYIENTTPSNDVKFYSLTLVLKELKTKLIGTDLKLVFFPGQINESEIPVSLELHWGIKRYLSEFNMQSFSSSPYAFFEILLLLVDIKEEEFINGIIKLFFYAPNPYLDLVDTIIDVLFKYDNNEILIKEKTGKLKEKIDEVILEFESLKSNLSSDNLSFEVMAQKIVHTFGKVGDSILSEQLEVYQLLFEVLMNDIYSTHAKFDRLIKLFRTWIGDFSLKAIEGLLIPQFGFELHQISMALEFPRNWLIPMEFDGATWREVSDESVLVQLQFIAKGLQYHTTTGFDIGIDQDNMQFDLQRCMIPKLEMQLQFSGFKLDLSRKKNIAEAIADDRPTDFIGAYVEDVAFFLPDKWFQFDEDGSTLQLYGRNLLIGTGGLSGTIGIETGAGLDADLNAAPVKIKKDGTEVEIFFSSSPVKEKDEVTYQGGGVLEEGRYILVDGGSIEVNAVGQLKKFLPSDGDLTYRLGKKDDDKGWIIGFNRFHLKFWQNNITESEIKGFLTIPRFKQCGHTRELRIDIEAAFAEDGDFFITAKAVDSLKICFGNFFDLTLDTLSVGKDDNKAFLCLSGALSFENNNVLGHLISDPITVEKFCIYSDGTFEIEGGSIPLPASVGIPLGPAKVDITNIHLGSHVERGKKYKFFGFDGGVSVNPGGMDVRGEGVKYYFPADGSGNGFLRIEGIAIDLVIPGNVPKKDAALLVQGFLAIKEDYYQGALSFQMPKAKIAGGVSMKYYPRYPAWLAEAFLELSSPLLLGSTGLGIYGFKGLFGLRYIASKEAAGLSPEASWFDYYIAPPEKGVHVDKFALPDDTVGAKNPLSIGAGLSLATAADDGKAFSSQLFLLLSLPKLIMLEGKANVLGDRVGMTDDPPPFFAALILSPGESVEIGLGADYKLRGNGMLLSLQADVRAAFFFKNPTAWYVHFGTDKKPIKALVFNFIHSYAYLMLNAKGIQVGAGAHLGFTRRYGPVSASVAFYFNVWGRISFERPQIGAGANVGGHVDIKVFGIGFYIGFAAGLSVEVPKPFRIYGYIRLCVGVKLLFVKFHKCFNVKFEWVKNSLVETSPVPLLPSNGIGADTQKLPVVGIHIPTGNSYRIDYFGSSRPTVAQIDNLSFVPLDTYIDVQFEKSLDPTSVTSVIGGATHGTDRHIEMIPPQASSGQRQVRHSYKIHQVNIFIWDGTDWKDYHPYEALSTPAALDQLPNNPAILKAGYWQKNDLGYNKFRLLAQTPFNYMDPVGGYVPEQAGLTAATLYCVDKKREKHCMQFPVQDHYVADEWHYRKKLLFRITKQDGRMYPFPNVYNVPQSLVMRNDAVMELVLPETSCCVDLKLFTFAKSLTVSFYEKAAPKPMGEDANGQPQFSQTNGYELVEQRTLYHPELVQPISFDNADQPILRVVIEPCKKETNQEQEHELGPANPAKPTLPAESASVGLGRRSRTTDPVGDLPPLRKACCITEEDMNEEKIHTELDKCEFELERCLAEKEKLKNEHDRFCQRKKVALEVVEVCVRRMRNEHIGKEYLECLRRFGLMEDEESETLQPFQEKAHRLEEEMKSFTDSYARQIEEVYEQSQQFLQEMRVRCRDAKEKLEATQNECQALEGKIKRLRQTLEKWQQWKQIPEQYHCSTFIHEVCWLTESSRLYNETIPSQEAIAADFDAMQGGIEKTIAPIWRPGKYLVHVELSDTVTFGSSQTHTNHFYYGFQAAGPVGHFPVDKIQPTVNPPNTDEPPIELPETSLKYYIDYQKSYPNANGELLYAKPLYYKNPKLLLFYTKPYVWHFFSDWPSYKGMPALRGQLEIQIKDPTEDALDANPTASPVLITLPVASIKWQKDPDPSTPEAVQVINNLVHPELTIPDYDGQHCWQVGGEPIQPPSLGTTAETKHLLPKKLYTAVINNHFENEKREVHRYVFQTSRYPSFKAHIESYRMKGRDGSSREAVFEIPVNMTATMLDYAFEMVRREPNPSYPSELATVYADHFQRLTEGLLKVSPMGPPVCTEINLLRNEATGELVAIWIRSPEPFNDPKIPVDRLRNTVQVSNNSIKYSIFFPLFSRDRSQVFLMEKDAVVLGTELKFQFTYLRWNGKVYESEEVEIDAIKIG